MIRSAWAIMAVAFAFAVPAVQAPAPGTKWTLGKVEVVGGKRLGPADILQLAGLKPGSPIDEAGLADIAKRLSGTGLFNTIGYRYTQRGLTLDVTFDIEEPVWSAHVVFDNFVTIPDADLAAAVKQRVPTFDGTAPATPGIIDYLTATLTSILAERGMSGEVTYMAGIPEGREVRAEDVTHIFRVVSPGLVVCSAEGRGVSSPFAGEVSSRLKTLVGHDYSRYAINSTASQIVSDVYRHKGFWDAAIGAPQPSTVSSASCAGVSVVVPITEGEAFSWDRITWEGTGDVPVADLDKMSVIKPGDVADESKLAETLNHARDAYRRVGYMAEAERVTPSFDRSTHRIALAINVDQGARYTMGKLNLIGLSDKDAASARKEWQLATGATFDASYLLKFTEQTLVPNRNRWFKSYAPTIKADRTTHVVDITILFK